MKTFNCVLTKDNFDSSVDRISKMSPDLLCTFFSPEYAFDDPFLGKFLKNFPETLTVGCSTAGEISDEGVTDGGISLIAVKFDRAYVEATSEDLHDAGDSRDAAANAAKRLINDELAAVLVLSPGLNVNGSEVVAGVNSVVGPNIRVFGGLAGDNAVFSKTFTMLSNKFDEKSLILVGFYGKNLQVTSSSCGGWKTFGVPRKVTKSTGNVLFEIDGKPALDLYKHYLKEKASELPASGLLYPFAILDEDKNETGIIRTILDVNEDDKSLVLAGDLAEGSTVSLMHAEIDDLIDGAEDAASKVHNSHQVKDSFALLVSCVGRKIIMQDEVDEEVDVAKDILGEHTAFSGFYSYGEICPFSIDEQAVLHNQTMTITKIIEES